MATAQKLAALRKAVRDGGTVLILGNEFESEAGYPSRDEFARELLAPHTYQVDRAFSVGDELADMVRQATGLGEMEDLLVLRFGEDREPPTDLVALSTAPFRGVVTTMWSALAWRAFERRNPLAMWPGSPAEIEATDGQRGRRMPLVQLHGLATVPRDVSLSWGEYGDRIADEPGLERLIREWFSSKSLLFVGCTPRDIRDLMRMSRAPRETQVGKNYALLHAARLEPNDYSMFKSYGVTAVVYKTRMERRKIIGSLATTPKSAAPQQPPSNFPLRRITLTNIGPFASFSIPFNRRLTAILGDNASGKTTVLRALALALSGMSEDPSRLGRNLLRSGTTSGKIVVSCGNERFVTRLWRSGNEVAVSSERTTPVQSGALLALGFPASRGVVSDALLGPGGVPPHDSPAFDLYPMMTGNPDGRLDDVSQWLVNAYARREDDALATGYFSTLNRLLPGMDIRYAGVNPEDWSVHVSTPDGILELKQLSSGILAVMGWVGVLLERLHRGVGENTPRPERPAIVVIDELDLHLHPEWQRKIVPLLRDTFPEVQFIISSHSPLIVGSLPRKTKIVQLVRGEDSGVTGEEVTEDFRGLRADQILTGPAFDLPTTTDEDTERLLSTYVRAFSASHETSGDALIEQIAQTLHERLRPQGETPSEIAGIELARDLIAQRMASLSDERRREVAAMASEYLDRLSQAGPR